MLFNEKVETIEYNLQSGWCEQAILTCLILHKVNLGDAISMKCWETSKLLINYLSDITKLNRYFVLACTVTNQEIGKLLLDKGADANANGGAGLWQVARRGNLEFVEMLIDRGANPSLDNCSAHSIAINRKHYEVAKLLEPWGVHDNGY